MQTGRVKLLQRFKGTSRRRIIIKLKGKIKVLVLIILFLLAGLYYYQEWISESLWMILLVIIFVAVPVADMMLHLQKIGCHNINLVTPTHVMPHIVNAVRTAFKKGLRLPLVYNTSGYERFEILKILDGIVDIYLPDMKFMDADQAEKYLGEASDYPEMSQQAVLEMHRQVGLHRADSRGIAVRGLMIRHLVMPNRVAGTDKFIKWVAENLPKSTYVNIMHQYFPDYEAFDYPDIWRRINVQEYLEAMR
jgi:putative pyruvate formate lyase activating enzyme